MNVEQGTVRVRFALAGRGDNNGFMAAADQFVRQGLKMDANRGALQGCANDIAAFARDAPGIWKRLWRLVFQAALAARKREFNHGWTRMDTDLQQTLLRDELAEKVMLWIDPRVSVHRCSSVVLRVQPSDSG